jgi:hypothetical protein
VNNLPTGGVPIYVRLSTRFTTGGWASNSYTYTAAPGNIAAVVQTPAPNSTLAGTSVTFTWNTGTGAAEYWLEVGTTPGGAQRYNASTGTTTSATVNNLPTGGVPIYVRLSTRFTTGGWASNSYTYTSTP